ncbi:lycopene beta-cyclase CrtY [Noviherbaspirillum galbum]|uniref:Lycopene beta-cyclase CrtY n=1 Tax=Noviherbaspirillum galbum TaxID=2709383 RepID=A0A6B3SFK3_9BURK|nr:lycopene beta-cyclase CrtY [Noviherbaspirillum galbum]NEX59601.1 lycopene beta-cyclase CrtY [Noviherbaspirillum galbum]
MHDLILVGGGLANGLIAWRLGMLHPGRDIVLLEQGDKLGGNHTWSFYRSDLTPEQFDWLGPLVAHSWPAYEVRFPGHRRVLETSCFSLTSSRFHEALTANLGHRARLNVQVTDVTADGVTVNGRRLEARAVIDGRGYAPSPYVSHAYQKFVGQEIVLAAPHGQSLPIIMDATVPQHDGYRFVYTLPLNERRILVEDTYYSGSPGLEREAVRARIADYVRQRGWRMDRVEREEDGILPVALAGDIDAFWNEPLRSLPCSGLRAGMYHATTGYSLPCAVRLAEQFAFWPADDSAALRERIRQLSVTQWREQGFMRLLNRMLFFAGQPASRYRVLERFYTLPRALIERFYAGRLRRLDQLRILSGKPPVPVLPALRAAMQTGQTGQTGATP